jgi:hypothetical protein
MFVVIDVYRDEHDVYKTDEAYGPFESKNEAIAWGLKKLEDLDEDAENMATSMESDGMFIAEGTPMFMIKQVKKPD